MPRPRSSALLRIFVGENDRANGKPLHEAIVLKAREGGLGGATVVRGVLGYGRSSALHTAKILTLSDDLPMIVEIVDDRNRIETFLDEIGSILGSALVTIENVEVVRYGERQPEA